LEPGNRAENGEATASEWVPSDPAPIWILIDKIYHGTKWIRIRGKGLAGDIKIERIGKTTVSVEWKVFYGRGAGKWLKAIYERGPQSKDRKYAKGRNGPRFWVRIRW
jgi:hypothetical protein